MKRINLIYQGQLYTMADRAITSVEEEVASIIASGQPGWLDVNSGEGTARPARLLITSSVSLTLVPIDPDEVSPQLSEPDPDPS